MPTKTKEKPAQTSTTITIATANLKLATDPTARIAVTSKGAAILQNVLLKAEAGKLTATGTDAEFWISQTVDYSSFDDFAICVPAKDLRNLVKALPGPETEIQVSETKLTLKSGQAKFELPVMIAGDYPNPEFPKDEIVNLVYSMGGIRNALSRVEHCRITGDKDVAVKPSLGGVNWRDVNGELFLECCDSTQAARCRIEGKMPEWAVCVKHEWLSEITDFPAEDCNEIVLQLSDTGYFGCEFNGRRVEGRQVLGNFPPTEKVFPKSKDDCLHSAKFDKDVLKEAINLAGLPSRSDPMYVGLVEMTRIDSEIVLIRSSQVCQSKGETTCAYDGELPEDFRSVFDERMLMAHLAACPSDGIEVSFGVKNPRGEYNRSIVLAGVNDDSWVGIVQEKSR